jgi:hypothetical protein
VAPRTNDEEFPPGMIGRTNYPNTPEGFAALTKTIRNDAIYRERMRVENNNRRAAGDYGDELGNADEALRIINQLAYPEDLLQDTIDMVNRASQLSQCGHIDRELLPDQLDSLVEALATYAQELTIQTQNLDWTSKTIRNGVEPDDDTPR